MDLAGYVITAVLVEGRSVKDVCESHDISRSWLYELIARYRELGDEGLKPQSRRPRSSPTRVPLAMEDEIVALRKGVDRHGARRGCPHDPLPLAATPPPPPGGPVGGDDLAGAVPTGL